MVKHRQKNKNEDSSHYKLLNGKVSDEESGDETELFVRKKPLKEEFPTVEKIVEEGDTLQALAIKYRCSVAELKRINNIHKENEIFAKRVIKVPHRPFTLALAGVHISGNNSPESNSVVATSKLIDIDSLSTKLNESITTPKPENEVNKIIFNSNFIPNQSDINNSIVSNEDCNETINLLPQNVPTVVENDPVISRLSCNGADGDISWKVLIVCVVIIIVALPLIYVFYIAEHPEVYHHHGS